MSIQVYWFTEQSNSYVTEEDLERDQTESYMTFPNRYFDPQKAHILYNQYHEQYAHADEVGFDGIMTNEHHNAYWCMKPAPNLDAAVLCKVTTRCKIAILGNVLPITENPVRLAEEIAMLDVYSGGRIISGFVRGEPIESLQANINPTENRERFEEAHDLIIKTWTTPGPFRWEGKYYHHRIVNPWVLPMQKPHPPIWYPGVSSVESVTWAAERGYGYMSLNTLMDVALQSKQIYRDTARKAGFEAGPEHFGYLVRAFVADTDEKAQELGRHFLWNGRFRTMGPKEHFDPPGYRSRESAKIFARRLGAQGIATEGIAAKGIAKAPSTYEEQQEAGTLIIGSPTTVINKLKLIKEQLDPGYLLIWGYEGPVPHDAAMRSIELWGREVIPALKEP